MILAMVAEGWVLGLVLPYVITGPHNIGFSIIFTIVVGVVFLAGAYYLAKGFAWLLFRLNPPRS
jgi:hypothetical protein